MSTYTEWVTAEAKAINSDGCSKVTDIHKICCYEHDLAYHYGRDPREAFQLGWEKARKIDRGYADGVFRECNQTQSKLKDGSPMALWRWLGVRLGGWNAWRKHRKLRP